MKKLRKLNKTITIINDDINNDKLYGYSENNKDFYLLIDFYSNYKFINLSRKNNTILEFGRYNSIKEGLEDIINENIDIYEFDSPQDLAQWILEGYNEKNNI